MGSSPAEKRNTATKSKMPETRLVVGRVSLRPWPLPSPGAGLGGKQQRVSPPRDSKFTISECDDFYFRRYQAISILSIQRRMSTKIAVSEQYIQIGHHFRHYNMKQNVFFCLLLNSRPQARCGLAAPHQTLTLDKIRSGEALLHKSG